MIAKHAIENNLDIQDVEGEYEWQQQYGPQDYLNGHGSPTDKYVSYYTACQK